MKFLLITCIMILVLVAGGVYAFLYLGLVSFRADQSPSAFEQKYAMKALDASTKHYAADIENPIQMTDVNLLEGMKLYQAKCAACHGDPGNPQLGAESPFYPPAPRFLKDPPDLPGSQNFYIIKHGIRWTGMPAWGSRLNDDQIWKLTAFLSQMGKLPPAVDQEWKKGKNAAGSGGDN